MPVRWPLWLGSISEAEASSNIHGLTLLPAGDANSQIILCDVDVSQYPHLKIANGGDPLEVTGIVGEVSLSGYAIRLNDVRLVFQGPRPPLQFLKNPEGKAGTVSYPITEESPNEISEIRFDYLPASLLDNGWVPANSNVGASGNGSIPLDCPGGLTRVAGSSDAVDFRLEKFQRACNGLRFRAKLCDGAHVYAKVQLVPSDGRNVPKSGWIACDIGDKSPEQRPHEEWVIFRKPQKYGWALFDLYLPDEIKRTFGHREGFELGELLGIRLRGSLSVSPIKLYLEEEVKPSDSQP